MVGDRAGKGGRRVSDRRGSNSSLPCLDQPCDQPRYVNAGGRAFSRCKPHLDAATRRYREERGEAPKPRPKPVVLDVPMGEGSLTAGGALRHVSPSALVRQERIASGEAHVIADVRFGDGRFTECTCGWRCTGRDDEAMARTWNAHPVAMRAARQRAKDREGLVVVAPA